MPHSDPRVDTGEELTALVKGEFDPSPAKTLSVTLPPQHCLLFDKKDKALKRLRKVSPTLAEKPSEQRENPPPG